MQNWQELTSRVLAKSSPTASWKSDQRSIIRIFNYASAHGLDPSELTDVDICKLRTIIRKAKELIAVNDTEELQLLFHLAASKTVVDLRLVLGIATPTEIRVKKVGKKSNQQYVISLSPEQYSRIKYISRLAYQFKLQEEINEPHK